MKQSNGANPRHGSMPFAELRPDLDAIVVCNAKLKGGVQRVSLALSDVALERERLQGHAVLSPAWVGVLAAVAKTFPGARVREMRELNRGV